jgi:hypothetical protein
MPSTNTNTDQTTAAVLERMFTAWQTLLLKAAAEHLIGGEHSIIEGAKKAETLSLSLYSCLSLGPSDLACCKNLSRSFSVKEINHSPVLFKENIIYASLHNVDATGLNLVKGLITKENTRK